MKKKYQVFISSTYEDLKDERIAVTQCLLDNDCIPVGMEQFPASDMSQMEYIKKILDDCDYYILILAGRYGSLDKDGMGFTEKEFDYAKSKDIPVLSFVIEDIGMLPSHKCEQTDKGRRLLNKFREKVCSNSMIKKYTNIDSLQGYVSTSINKCIKDHPAIGWVRGNEISPPEDLEKKFEEFLSKRIATKKDINALFAELDSMPKIHYGTEPPTELKTGDLFVQIEKESDSP